MKAALGCRERDGSGCRIEFKELVVGQNFVRMVGYCLKDQGLPHFIMTKKNISDEEMERGIAEHTALKLNYMDGFISLNRANLFQRSHTFWTNYLADQPNADFAEVLAAMLNSKKYMLTSTLLMNNNGQMRPEAAEAYWAIIKGTTVTKFDMMKIIYLPTGGFNPFRNVTPGMMGVSTIDATPVRPASRAALNEFKGLLSDGDGDDKEEGTVPRTRYEKIKRQLVSFRARQAQRVVMDDDEEEDDEAGGMEEAPGGSDE